MTVIKGRRMYIWVVAVSALVFVGVFMSRTIRGIGFPDMKDAVSAFLTRILMLLEPLLTADLMTRSSCGDSTAGSGDIKVQTDFCGMEIPDEFVCGYGLDYAQKYRNVPYVGMYTGSPD